MKIVLFGPNGQVGWELQRSLAPLGDLIALDRAGRVRGPFAPDDAAHRNAAAPSTWSGDLARPESVAATIRAIAPDVIVNAAAYTAVDRAESEADAARTINATAPGVIAREAAALGAWLVHFSTDYVFDGSGTKPWREDDATAPCNVYGSTKLEGENAIRASGCRHLIVRTSWVYAARGGNFAKTMLALASTRDRLRVVADQYGAPTGAELLADLGAHMLRVARVRPEVSGTYHAAAGGETTWHGYASHVIERARSAGRPIKVAASAIEGVPSSAYPTPAKRPANSRLDTTRLRATFDLVAPRWQDGVDRMLAETFAAG